MQVFVFVWLRVYHFCRYFREKVSVLACVCVFVCSYLCVSYVCVCVGVRMCVCVSC